MSKYYATTISLNDNGFGDYEAKPIEKLWDDENELLGDFYENYGKVYELGKDELPDDVQDIKNQIYKGPDRVFAFFSEPGNIEYFGICNLDRASYDRLEALSGKESISSVEWAEIKNLPQVYAYSNFERGTVQLVNETFDWKAGDGQTEGVIKTYHFNIHENLTQE